MLLLGYCDATSIYSIVSIVIGDKHEHVPKRFYFGLFTLFFGIISNVEHVPKAFQFIKRHKLLVWLLFVLFASIVRYNTMVHKYLLADNRHYIFYIWNRLYGRYVWFKYANIISLLIFFHGIEHMRETFKAVYYLALFAAICFQRFLELRYFLVPFVIYRLHLQSTQRHTWLKWLELAFYLVLNTATFYIFFTKEIKWSNYREPQRIMW